MAAGGLRDHPGRARPLQEDCSKTHATRGRRSSATSTRCSWAWWPRTATWEHHGGKLRFSDSSGNIIADQIGRRRTTRTTSASRVQKSSYLKSPYYKPLGFPGRHVPGRPAGAPQRLRPHGHAAGRRRAARYCEKLGRRRGDIVLPLSLRAPDRDPRLPRDRRALMDDPDLFSDHLRAEAGINKPARRGRERGARAAPSSTTTRWIATACIQKVNLIIATGQNNLAMNRSVAQIASIMSTARRSRNRAQPRRARDPLLRPVPELLDPRAGQDADGGLAGGARRSRGARGRPRRMNDLPVCFVVGWLVGWLRAGRGWFPGLLFLSEVSAKPFYPQVRFAAPTRRPSPERPRGQ